MPNDSSHPNRTANHPDDSSGQPTDTGNPADSNDVTNTDVNPEHHLTATADIPGDDPQEIAPARHDEPRATHTSGA